VLAEGVGLGAGVRGQVIEVGGVGFRFHIPDGRVLVEDGEVGSSDGGARRLVNEGQVGAQRAQQAFQRAVVGEFACRAGLLRDCTQASQVVYQRVHAGESVPDGVGEGSTDTVLGRDVASTASPRTHPARDASSANSGRR
jgi:hypothetical protein